MSADQAPIVGIFPTLKGTGGIQSSGSEAWRALHDRFGPGGAHALYYAAGSSKAATALAALASFRRPRSVLVWHLGLLKLLPFVDATCSRGILFLHGIEAWTPLDPVTAYLAGRSALILTNSHHTWRRFVDHNPALAGRPHKTVHLGAGSVFPAHIPAPSDPPTAIMIGRLNADEGYKGHREVIEVWPIVRRRIGDARLQILGDGSQRAELERLCRQTGVDGAVEFKGQLPDSERDRLIAESRCLALPSRGEGFGLVYVEAMRMGRPSLVSTLDAGREVVNPPEAGLAVDPRSRAEVADGLCRLLDGGQEWHDWSRKARARYEAQFTSERFRRRLVDAILDVHPGASSQNGVPQDSVRHSRARE